MTIAAVVAARWLLQAVYLQWQAASSEGCERWMSERAADHQRRVAYQTVRSAARCERWVSARAADRQRWAAYQSVRAAARCER